MKIYIIPAISFLCSFLYYLPWIADPGKSLGAYIIAFFWFLAAWIPLLIHLYLGIRKKIKKEEGNIYLPHLVVALCILISYGIVVIGIVKGYMVTV